MALPNTLLGPRFEQRETLNIVGLAHHMDESSPEVIPQLWGKLMQNYWHEIQPEVADVAYGLCIDLDRGQCLYLAGREVRALEKLPDALTPFVIPAQSYAVFSVTNGMSGLLPSIHAIFDDWLPNSGVKLTTAAKNRLHFFEQYDERYNAMTGEGVIELWVAIESQA